MLLIGGSTGTGLELIKRLSEKGCRLHVLSRNSEAFVGMPQVTPYPFDITDADSSFPEIADALHGLVYLPGTIQLKPFRGLKPEHFQQDLDINFMGLVKTLQHYLKPLKKSKNASVVAFSTVAVQTGMAYHASVAAAKGAVEGLVRSLAAELAPEIRVNAIAPSLTETQMGQPFLNTESKRQNAENRHPLKRVGQPKDMAAMADFLLSDDASWITGEIMQISGGMAATRSL